MAEGACLARQRLGAEYSRFIANCQCFDQKGKDVFPE